MNNYRRNTLNSAVLAAVMLLAAQAWAGAAGGGHHGLRPPWKQKSFVVAVIPDTQFMSNTDVWSAAVADNTRWLRANARARNIAFVTHLGDIVQEGSVLSGVFPGMSWEEQWRRMSRAMDPLDLANRLDGTALPYSVSIGNHDVTPTNDKANGDDIFENSAYIEFFGPGRYKNYPWYGGSDSTGLNHYQVFSAGPYRYLHINLEIDPQNAIAPVQLVRTEADAFEWAQSVIDRHRGMPTLISTHKYLTDFGPEGFDETGYRGDGADNSFGGERMSTGEAIWEKLVRGNRQVFMTINGHEHEGKYREDGEHHQVKFNDAGLPVFEVLSNYQDYVNPLTGSDPYMRLIEFNPSRGEIRHTTYSPTFDAFNRVPGFAQQRLDDMLDAFENEFLPVVQYLGEDIAGVVLADNPKNRSVAAALNEAFREEVGQDVAFLSDRAGAEAALLSFFGVSDRAKLGAAVSPRLTDRDSQFTVKVRFDRRGRPRKFFKVRE